MTPERRELAVPACVAVPIVVGACLLTASIVATVQVATVQPRCQWGHGTKMDCMVVPAGGIRLGDPLRVASDMPGRATTAVAGETAFAVALEDSRFGQDIIKCLVCIDNVTKEAAP